VTSRGGEFRRFHPEDTKEASMLLRVAALVCAFILAGSDAPAQKLVRVDFTGEIANVTGNPFGFSWRYWSKNKKVTGHFVYDPATPNALTPEQVKKKRTCSVAGSRRKHTFKHQTTHIYMQNLRRPSFEMNIDGHKILGSGRSKIHIKYRELDTMNNQFLFKDGKPAYMDYAKRHKHGRLTVDGRKVKDAEFTVHIFDQGQRLKSADLPARFPFATGKGLHAGINLEIGRSSFGIPITKMTSKTIRR
jgi:hypothetical protein